MSAMKEIVIPVVKGQKHLATIICLHGLGDSGAGWTFLAENWRQRGKFTDIKFIFPNAPSIPITVNGGMRMPGWYDIANFNTINRTDDEPGIMRSRTYIHGLVEGEMKDDVPVILGGFSQGAAMSIFSGLTLNKQLAGIFALSGYQVLESKFDQLRQESGNHKPCIFVGHGDSDPVVLTDWGRAAAKGLKSRGYQVEFHEYRGLPHSASPQELDDLEKWVADRLKGAAESSTL